jgi:hypothetical protein
MHIYSRSDMSGRVGQSLLRESLNGWALQGEVQLVDGWWAGGGGRALVLLGEWMDAC